VLSVSRKARGSSRGAASSWYASSSKRASFPGAAANCIPIGRSRTDRLTQPSPVILSRSDMGRSLQIVRPRLGSSRRRHTQTPAYESSPLRHAHKRAARAPQRRRLRSHPMIQRPNATDPTDCESPPRARIQCSQADQIQCVSRTVCVGDSFKDDAEGPLWLCTHRSHDP
jgi:hypothetical protein